MGIEFGFFVGAVILFAAIAWGIWSYNRRNMANEPITEEATRELYKDEDGYAAKEAALRARTRA